MKARRLALVAALALLVFPAAASAARLYAAAEAPQRVIGFDSASPGTIVSNVPITGLAGTGEVLKGLDLRPSTGELILLTRAPTGASRIYRLDPTTGVASQPVQVIPDLTNAEFGVDVDPVDDNLRVIGTDDTNRSVDLATGEVTDSSLADAGVATFDGLAYGLAGPAFVALDSTADNIFSGSGDGETTLGLPTATNPVGDTPVNTALDIVGNDIFLVTHEATGAHAWKSTALGTFVDQGAIDGNPDVRGMTVADNLVRFAQTTVSGGEGDTATLVVQRDALSSGGSTVNWAAGGGLGSGSATFAAGETSKSISISIPQDTADEAVETVAVTLAGTTSSVPVAPRTAQLRVLDDDETPPVTVPGPERVVTVEAPAPAPPPAVRPPLPGRCSNPLLGSVGDDALVGTVFGDRIDGAAGADALVGRSGDDCLIGGPGNDWLNGADGNDDMRGDSGEDFLLGGRGNDIMVGGNGDDRLAGGDGNDVLSGGGGSNHIVGGSGADRINVKNGRKDTVDCGGGRDRASIDLRRDKTRGCEIIPGA